MNSLQIHPADSTVAVTELLFPLTTFLCCKRVLSQGFLRIGKIILEIFPQKKSWNKLT